METKQTQVEKLVVSYFRQRSDTDIVYNDAGAYHVALNSVSAQQDFGSNEPLNLVFEADKLAVNFDSELISSAHPFLDVIRNDLESNQAMDPRLSEAYVLLHLLDQDGRLVIPDLTFSGGQQRFEYQLGYTPTFILTYRIVYDTDQRSENIVRLCYDAHTGELQAALLPKLERFYIASGYPVQAKNSGNIDLTRILEAGRREVERRILIDTKTIEHEISSRLMEDRERLETHYKAKMSELRVQDIVGRQQLEVRLEKDIQELENKYVCRVSIRLLSALKLWWPIVDYTINLSSRSGDLRIQGGQYDSQVGKTKFHRCPECGNHTKFEICVVGRHIKCGGTCSQGLMECATCHDSMCPDHGGPCNHCAQLVCKNDRESCSYGKHANSTYYCPDCLVRSFEDKPLCKNCLEYCGYCERPFAHEHMNTCRVGGERICQAHNSNPCGQICQECDQITCKDHGIYTAEQTWVCSDHARTASCCERVFALSRLEECCVAINELLCPDHRFECADCSKTVCETHSSTLKNHKGKRVCDNCRVTCDLCSNDLSYIARDLAQCVTCSKIVCVNHRQTCAVCNRTVCREDIIISGIGETLCSDHAGRCDHCASDQAIYRKENLKACVFCGASTCKEHHTSCEICERTYVCNQHLSELPQCTSCGRTSCQTNGCSTEMQICRDCGMAYCSHCFTRNGQCTTCADLFKLGVSQASQKVIDWLRRTRQMTTGENQELINAMLQHETRITFKQKKNNTYQVFVVRCDPPLIQKFLSWHWSLSDRQMRIVIDAQGKIKRIKSEKIKNN